MKAIDLLLGGKRARNAIEGPDVAEPPTKPAPAPVRPAPAPTPVAPEPRRDDPFHVPRPEVLPRPQNRRYATAREILGEAYEDEAHPGTVGWFRNPDDEHLRDHPVLRPHGHELASGAFAHSSEKFRSRNVQMQQLLRVFTDVQRREAAHREELVALAKRAVAQVWGVSEDMLTGELGDADPNDTAEHFEAEPGATVDARVKGHVHMRASLNMLTHGAAVHQMQTLHHLVIDELNAIDPHLMELYDKLSSGTVHHYWFADIRAMAEMLKHAAVGSANVDWPEDGGKPVVVAKGVCFPVLCQEMSKGLMMLLSSHHLSSLDRSTAISVMKHADRIDQEPWYIMVGPELWRRFVDVLGTNVTHAQAVAKLAKMTPEEAHKVIVDVIQHPERAKKVFQQSVPEALSGVLDGRPTKTILGALHGAGDGSVETLMDVFRVYGKLRTEEDVSFVRDMHRMIVEQEDFDPYSHLTAKGKIDSVEDCYLSISPPNTKLGQIAAPSFSLPAGYTCPYADACKSFTDRHGRKSFTNKKGEKTVVKDVGDERCYAASQEVYLPSLRKLRWRNLDLLNDTYAEGGIPAVVKLMVDSIRRYGYVRLFRIHDSGDFFEQWYFDAWIRVARAMPDVLFYAYTKSLPMWVKRKATIPSNLRLIASEGGTKDELIDKHSFRRAVVVKDEGEAIRRKLRVDVNDFLAALGDEDFALLLHGTQSAESGNSAIARANGHRIKKMAAQFDVSPGEIEGLIKHYLK